MANNTTLHIMFTTEALLLPPVAAGVCGWEGQRGVVGKEDERGVGRRLER